MKWFGRSEKRADTNAGSTNAAIQQRVRTANRAVNNRQIDCIEAAAGVWARAFSTAQTNPQIEGMTSQFFDRIGRSLVLKGECLFVSRLRTDSIQYLPVSKYEITGGADPESWVYNCQVPAPSGQESVKSLSAGVLHFRYGQRHDRPWQGVSPLESAGISVGAVAQLQERLLDELSTPVTYVVGHPKSIGTDRVTELAGAFSDVGGGIMLIEDRRSVADSEKLLDQWKQNRVGAEPPQFYPDLMDRTFRNVLSACGVPPALFEPGGDGTGHREAWRRFLFGTILPVSRKVGEQISSKVQPVNITFNDLHASDITSRSRALAQMVGAGMKLEEAQKFTGFEND